MVSLEDCGTIQRFVSGVIGSLLVAPFRGSLVMSLEACQWHHLEVCQQCRWKLVSGTIQRFVSSVTGRLFLVPFRGLLVMSLEACQWHQLEVRQWCHWKTVRGTIQRFVSDVTGRLLVAPFRGMCWHEGLVGVPFHSPLNEHIEVCSWNQLTVSTSLRATI